MDITEKLKSFDKKKDKLIALRVDDDLYEFVETNAKIQKMSMSKYVRNVLLIWIQSLNRKDGFESEKKPEVDLFDFGTFWVEE